MLVASFLISFDGEVHLEPSKVASLNSYIALKTVLDVLILSLSSRHCGRLLCAKCCNKQMPILKYELTKPVRVCEVCFDFLTVGPM